MKKTEIVWSFKNFALIHKAGNGHLYRVLGASSLNA